MAYRVINYFFFLYNYIIFHRNRVPKNNIYWYHDNRGDHAITYYIILWIQHRFVLELQKCYKCMAPYNGDPTSVYNIICAWDQVWRGWRTCPGILNSTICIYSFRRHGRGCWRVERPSLLCRQIQPAPLSSLSIVLNPVDFNSTQNPPTLAILTHYRPTPHPSTNGPTIDRGT